MHEVLWDVPVDGLQLPSISTAKCGDTIRFRCPLHATHGLYKLEPSEWGGQATAATACCISRGAAAGPGATTAPKALRHSTIVLGVAGEDSNATQLLIDASQSQEHCGAASFHCVDPLLLALRLPPPPHPAPAAAAANYNGTCPQSFDQPMIGETVYEPKKGCDFSIKLEEGPDFFLTSHIPGACQKNLKVYVHTVCVKTENTFASNLFNSLPALPSFGSGSQLSSAALGRADRLARRHAAAEADSGALPAAGYAGVVGGLPNDIPGAVMGGANAPTLGAMRPASRMAASLGAEQGVLEQAKQSSTADVRPVLASLVLAVAAAALVL